MRSRRPTAGPLWICLPASDGNVYGLTGGGGDFGNGTIFVIDPGGSFTTIHSIPLSAGTAHVQPRQGKRRPVLRHGGRRRRCRIRNLFAIDEAGTLTILHSFGGLGNGDGSAPAGLIQARDGRLYGTTRRGGAFVGGTVYSIDLDRRLSSRCTVSVRPLTAGSPGPDLLEASDGNLYGVTSIPRCSGSIRAGTLTTLHESDCAPRRES